MWGLAVTIFWNNYSHRSIQRFALIWTWRSWPKNSILEVIGRRRKRYWAQLERVTYSRWEDSFLLASDTTNIKAQDLWCFLPTTSDKRANLKTLQRPLSTSQSCNTNLHLRLIHAIIPISTKVYLVPQNWIIPSRPFVSCTIAISKHPYLPSSNVKGTEITLCGRKLQLVQPNF